ncbi:Serine/threonine-protein kinase Nek8 [Coelomomyces lativittatus]|nr:Serine/threonine-protein kinase Nek8 [Coelomomyces lativittatus]
MSFFFFFFFFFNFDFKFFLCLLSFNFQFCFFIQIYQVLGTPNYLSPELCRGDTYNEKSDIWAMGCILYELTTRKFMFDGSNLLAIIKKITDRIVNAPIPIDTTPSWLTHLIDGMTDLNADHRLTTKEIMEIPEFQMALAEVTFHEFSYSHTEH